MLVAHLILGSVTELRATDVGRHAIVGSHCGAFTGEFALQTGVASLIAHDAGVGLDKAGIVGLDLLDAFKIPAATASHSSARIGDANDILRRGIVSYANQTAEAIGVEPGNSIENALKVFQERAARTERLPAKVPTSDHRFSIFADGGEKRREILILDSASLVKREDEGAIVVTGSHGGLPGARKASAIKAKVQLAVFNDAGVGIDDAGIKRLDILDDRKVAAVAVDAWTARIGSGRSSYETGEISFANASATALGAKPKMRVDNFLQTLAEHS